MAARIETLPLDTTTEVMVLLEPMLAALRRQAVLALERTGIVAP